MTKVILQLEAKDSMSPAAATGVVEWAIRNGMDVEIHHMHPGTPREPVPSDQEIKERADDETQAAVKDRIGEAEKEQEQSYQSRPKSRYRDVESHVNGIRRVTEATAKLGAGCVKVLDVMKSGLDALKDLF